jgi:hypothetical protein
MGIGGWGLDKQISSVAGLELDSDVIPFDAKVETVLGCALAIFGALIAVKFKNIDGSTQLNEEYVFLCGLF